MDPEDQIAFRAGGLRVCADHISDGYLRAWIAGNAGGTDCDFCDRTSEEAFAADLGELAQLIFDGLDRDWTDLANELPYGFDYDSTRSTLEMLYEEEVTEDGRLAQALAGALPDYGWVQRDFFVLSQHDRLVANWQSFTELIMHKNRFFFPLVHADLDDPDAMSPLAILEELGRAAEAAGLLVEWTTDTPIFRARVHEADDIVTNSWHLAALPEDLADRAAANRMSAVGVPMFYGARDASAAVAEAKSAEPDAEDKVLSLGRFTTERPLRILDLSHGVDVPSQFDPDRGPLRAALAFLRAFVDDVARPVVRDGEQHLGYVPTQVVCEYFRVVHRFDDERAIDGIAYPSTQVDGAINVVLFATNLEVADANGTRPPLPDRLKFLGPHYPRDPAVLRLAEITNPEIYPAHLESRP